MEKYVTSAGEQKDIYLDSLHNNKHEKDKIDTTVSTFILLDVGGIVTYFDPFVGSSSVIQEN
jgi:hypothetical protein